jgi:hypothetical protein
MPDYAARPASSDDERRFELLMDMSVEESAGVLGISVSAVKARTARAAFRFRALMNQPEAAE